MSIKELGGDIQEIGTVVGATGEDPEDQVLKVPREGQHVGRLAKMDVLTIAMAALGHYTSRRSPGSFTSRPS